MSNTQQDLLKQKILEGLKGTNPSALASNNIEAEISGMSDAIDKARLTPTASTTPTLEDILGSTGYGANKTASDDYMERYKNHNFNFNANALYNQYAPQYQKQARLGMEDAIGRASALTGGYGSSYAQAVGQQAYYNQMDKLDDRILDLYNIAYGQYRDEKNDLLGMANYYNGLAQQDYDNAMALIGKMGEDEDDTPIDKKYPDIIEDLANYKTKEAQANRMADLVNKGVLSDYEATKILARYGGVYGDDGLLGLKERTWTKTKDGGGDFLGMGINRDAVVSDEYGNDYTLATLRQMLMEDYGLSHRDATKWIRDNIEKNLKIKT